QKTRACSFLLLFRIAKEGAWKAKLPWVFIMSPLCTPKKSLVGSCMNQSTSLSNVLDWIRLFDRAFKLCEARGLSCRKLSSSDFKSEIDILLTKASGRSSFARSSENREMRSKVSRCA